MYAATDDMHVVFLLHETYKVNVKTTHPNKERSNNGPHLSSWIQTNVVVKLFIGVFTQKICYSLNS